MRAASDFDKAFNETAAAHWSAFAILPNPVFVTNMKRIADFALQNRLPAIFHLREFARVGGLVSYGVDRSDLYRRAATYVDKILKGTSPAALPIEQPTQFELAVNLKTAKALGLTVPSTLLATADEVDRITIIFVAPHRVRLWPFSGHADRRKPRQLSGVKPTPCGRRAMSANDPERTRIGC